MVKKEGGVVKKKNCGDKAKVRGGKKCIMQ
jgi:hypothetical protein